MTTIVSPTLVRMEEPVQMESTRILVTAHLDIADPDVKQVINIHL